jgi:hypothetical protein
VRLGYWAPTPNRQLWERRQARLWPFHMLREFLSQTNDLSSYCYLTDGGHFDNTGLYSLVERGCRYIVVADCGADPKPCFEDLGNAIRRCRIDFHADIGIDLDPLFPKEDKKKKADRHFVVGKIIYSRDHARSLKWADADDVKAREGVIIVVKPTISDRQTVDVEQYRLENGAFPQQKTADQWFDEAQFESYRQLGELCAESLFDAKQISAQINSSQAQNALVQSLSNLGTESMRLDPLWVRTYFNEMCGAFGPKT